MDSAQPRSAPRSPPAAASYASSPPLSKQSTSSYPPMSPEAFAHSPPNASHFYSNSQGGQRYSIDRSSSSYRPNLEQDGYPGLVDGLSASFASVIIRNLSRSMSGEALNSMFLFVDDFVDARFASQSVPDDLGFQTAVARFGSMESAYEVRKKLNGRMNSSQEAHMVIELLHPQAVGEPNTEPLRKSSSGGSSSGSGQRQSSRYNSAFKTLEKRSPPPLPQGLSSNSDNSNPDANAQLHHFFSPQSPVGSGFGDRPRVSGKAVINDDADDETGELLKDPVAFARGGHLGMQRQTNNAGIPISRLANLSLNTNNTNSMPSATGSYANARSLPPLQSPGSETSPPGPGNGIPTSPTSGMPMSPQHFQRHHYPPANPADQNPPCNTLYVGNLPIDTSEDELKALFSKQRGYKRLCFRTKHNGPMCFVEFEDVSFATKALNELYGHPLHNSVKGGIRLSFSKNPLGVRTGQTNSMGGPQSPLSPNGAAGIGALGVPPGFSTANGPPPGLVAPPGLGLPISMNSMNTAGLPSTSLFGPASPPLTGSMLQGRGSFSGNYPNGMPNNPGANTSDYTSQVPGR